jgi:hypothetical protein
MSRYPCFALAVGGDGDVDLLSGGRSVTQLFLNNGWGVFSIGPALLLGAAYQAGFGDFDGDGDLNVATAFDGTGGGWQVKINGHRPTATVAQQASAFQVWPNPAPTGSSLQVSLSKAVASATVSLQTVTGQLVRLQQFSGSTTSVPTNALSLGIYLLTVTEPSRVPTVKRVMIQ